MSMIVANLPPSEKSHIVVVDPASTQCRETMSDTGVVDPAKLHGRETTGYSYWNCDISVVDPAKLHGHETTVTVR